MRRENEELMSSIDAFLAASGMSASTFGHKAVNDGKFVSRLRDGKRCWPETADKAAAFISANAWMCQQSNQPHFRPRNRQVAA